MFRTTRVRPRLITRILILLLAVAGLPWASPAAYAATLTVTTTSDSGAGSLRVAIELANLNAGDDTIVFDAATNGGTLLLTSPLPAITGGGSLTIVGNGATNTTVSGNSAVLVFTVAAGATASISGMTITGGDNVGSAGGGISNNGALTVVASVIRGNAATSGGGIYNNNGSSLTLVNSTVNANVAGVGGGIFGFGSTITMINSTVNANSGATGGGIFVNTATVALRNSIVANSISGGGDCVTAASTVTVQNSLVEDGTCGVTNGVNGNLIGDPALNPDLTLSALSPAIDAGLNSLIPAGVTADLAGNARIFGARVDMGAYESGLAPPPPPPPVLPLRAMLPLVVLPAPPPPLTMPDLIIEQIALVPDKASFAAGEPVEIRVSVKNVGDAPASSFWVDLYLNPAAQPGVVNQRWNEVCGLSPCYGMAWSVVSLAPGESIVLSSVVNDPSQSIWPGFFAPGTSVIYAFADSYNFGVPTGANLERSEVNNVAVLEGLSVTGGSLAALPAGAPATLPPRALP